MWVPKCGILVLSGAMPFSSDTGGLLPGTHKYPRLMWAGQLGTHLLSMDGTYITGSSWDKLALVW